MGNWMIIIEGHGANHNKDYEGDADKIGKEFAKKLAEKGQSITRASFIYGVPEPLLESE